MNQVGPVRSPSWDVKSKNKCLWRVREGLSFFLIASWKQGRERKRRRGEGRRGRRGRRRRRKRRKGIDLIIFMLLTLEYMPLTITPYYASHCRKALRLSQLDSSQKETILNLWLVPSGWLWERSNMSVGFWVHLCSSWDEVTIEGQRLLFQGGTPNSWLGI